MKKNRNTLSIVAVMLATVCHGAVIPSPTIADTDRIFKLDTPKTDVSLTIPHGFTATVFASGLGKARHITVTPSGYIYIKLASAKNGNTIVRLKDQNGDGVADEEMDFGSFKGTGIKVKSGWLYASSDEEIYRFKLDSDGVVSNPDQPEKIVTGLIARGEHEAKAFTLDNSGNIYVNIGAFSNSCQIEDRKTGSMGKKPCPILDSAAGIWQFKADRLNQTYADGVRYATGLRNVVGLDWNTTTNHFLLCNMAVISYTVFFLQCILINKMLNFLQNVCMNCIKDPMPGGRIFTMIKYKAKKFWLLNMAETERKQQERTQSIQYMHSQVTWRRTIFCFIRVISFPARYKNGAFIAFHGSWNRAPEPQAGFFVVFVPFTNGKPSGKWKIFANGFSGGPKNTASGGALHRPCGLAEGPDGALYVTDDVQGTIWRITYK